MMTMTTQEYNTWKLMLLDESNVEFCISILDDETMLYLYNEYTDQLLNILRLLWIRSHLCSREEGLIENIIKNKYDMTRNDLFGYCRTDKFYTKEYSGDTKETVYRLLKQICEDE